MASTRESQAGRSSEATHLFQTILLKYLTALQFGHAVALVCLRNSECICLEIRKNFPCSMRAHQRFGCPDSGYLLHWYSPAWEHAWRPQMLLSHLPCTLTLENIGIPLAWPWCCASWWINLWEQHTKGTGVRKWLGLTDWVVSPLISVGFWLFTFIKKWRYVSFVPDLHLPFHPR